MHPGVIMAKRAAKTKIRAMTPAAIAARKLDKHKAAVNGVADVVGLPDVQRDAERLVIVPTAIDGKPRTTSTTVRKLRKVEQLHRSGAIAEHHLRAIDLYVTAAETAYGACLRVASYGDSGGGSSPTGAAAAAHGRQLDRIGDAWRYDRARRAVPAPYVKAFEGIVLDNHPIGAVGAEMWPGSSAGAISGSMRELIRTCADAVYAEFEAELAATGEARVGLVKTMLRMNAAVKAEPAAPAVPVISVTPITDAVLAALMVLRDDEEASLYVSPEVLSALMREGGIVEQPTAWGPYPLVVQEHWRWGWIVQRA